MTADPHASWPPALRLVAALSAPEPGPEAEACAAALGQADWDAFADLAERRHRVAPVIAALGRAAPLPDRVRRRLDAAASETARLALAQVGEVRRLGACFSDLGVTPVVLKGWPLSQRLYGSIAARHGRDLDIYVPEADLAACHAAMCRLGYEPTPTHALRGRLVGTGTLLRECNDIEYRCSGTPLVTELMWRAHPVRGFPDLLQAPWATTWQETEAGRIRVPSGRADMIYLSIHGTMHMWARLKWLADIARLAAERGPAEVEGDLAAAREAHAWSQVAMGLILASRVFGTPLPGSLARPPARLLRSAERVLARIAMTDPALERLPARIGFYRLGLQLADTGAQRIGLLRFGAWRQLRLRLAETMPRLLGAPHVASGGANRPGGTGR